MPGPLGLPGGYPVVLSNARVEFDLPPGQDLEEAIAFNQRMGRHDGVEAIAEDGTVSFTERAAGQVREIAPWLTAPLHPDEALGRASRLRELLAHPAA